MCSSDLLNNTYIAFVRNEYAKNGINCPPGRLAYVQIPDLDQVFVFQFDNVNTWKSSTLEQVQIFADKNDLSKYFSFFTKDTGSVEYLAAKKYAQIRWAEFSTGEDAVDYASMQAILVALADDPNFQKVIDESYQ